MTHEPLNDYKKYNVNTEDVHSVIAKYMLADGFDLVLDLENSKGARIVDAKTGDEYLDLFTFFASNSIGMNHPKLDNEEFRKEIAESAINKPSNSDIYTTQMASFINTFIKIAKPDYMKHLFFISGGALAVENGLKVAFDWKVQKNFEKGITEEKGFKVIHFKEAFHGRTGYTMSLTNTDPTKIKYYPKFDWPRITNPKVIFPIKDNLETIIASEQMAITEIRDAIKNNPNDIAVIILEPIQGEGGDNFFRKEFFVKLRQIADENEIMLMFDEVQTGVGLTGKFWASEYYVKPDIISFGKKVQVCGIMVSDRVDEVKTNCFTVSSRINSTWGANLTDMVRSQRILQIIEEENLVENARVQGNYLLENLKKIQIDFPNLVSNARGLGLMCSFDLPDSTLRKGFRLACQREKVLLLGCGARSIRFRPPLNITKDELDEALGIIRKVLKTL
ncbi:MAG: L-lysine 6-transaminase [Ignavibacteriales bacterium CG_4_9_14_3_um_filter_30_11]|nr:L-lysine 6-transaminase [Ignavibacteria bacterium]PJA99467.1 MAG: L-lysine 6-transaminase [Ignavibacteriales bacterium CG_4_9_14_3_um_filter_30_11]